MHYDKTLSANTNAINSNNFKKVVFYILIGLTIFQQLPVIKDLYYGQIRYILYVGFGIFSIISLINIHKFEKFFFTKFFTVIVLYSFLLNIIIRIFDVNYDIGFEFMVPFGILICSFNTSLKREQLDKLLIWYIILSIILGVSSIFYYGEGFTITRNYFLRSKNQIGPLLGISTVITYIWIVNKKQFSIKYNYLLIKLIMFILLISSIIIIRNRSSLLGIFIVGLLAFSKEYKFKKNLKNIIIIQFIILLVILLSLLGVYNKLFEIIYKSIFLNYDINDINSVSASRVAGYKLALKFTIDYPILGELGAGKYLNVIPHNYILNKWVKYGIIGSLPLIMFYLYLWIFTVKEIYMKKNEYTLPLWILLFSLIVSLLEYTYPYGPGVSQLMVWFLLGQYLKMKNIA